MKYLFLVTILAGMILGVVTTINSDVFTADAMTTWFQGPLGYAIVSLGTLGSIIWYFIHSKKRNSKDDDRDNEQGVLS